MRHAAVHALLWMALAAGGARAQPALAAEWARWEPALARMFGTREGVLYEGASSRRLLEQLQAVLRQQPGEPAWLEGGYRVLHAHANADPSQIALLVTAGTGGDLVAVGALRRGCWGDLKQQPRTPCTALGTLSLFMAPGVGTLPGLELGLRAWGEAQLRSLEAVPPSAGAPASRRPPRRLLLGVMTWSRP